ncbi:MAG: hypothetical protein KGZ65_05415 [Sphingomonadales bacterium]|nr:hypothetical protein [Sphingomonadaceae bacterium]MBS3930655.1 hypothetical protein [Sphingomonadales bacterium]
MDMALAAAGIEPADAVAAQLPTGVSDVYDAASKKVLTSTTAADELRWGIAEG